MFRLNFTAKVMGKDGAEKLRRHEVTQTLREAHSGSVGTLLNRTLIVGDEIEVALDDELIGMASPSIIDRIDWDSLTLLDVTRGGFSNKPELYGALHRARYRARYRFQPMDSYLFYRIQFQWLDDQ